MKIALQAVLDECNKMAVELDAQQQAGSLKSRIASLEMEFASGAIDAKTYELRGAEILDELRRLSGAAQGGGG
jgi:hypothetical protein